MEFVTKSPNKVFYKNPQIGEFLSVDTPGAPSIHNSSDWIRSRWPFVSFFFQHKLPRIRQ